MIQPRTPPAELQEERRSFFDARPAASSSAAAAPSAPMIGLDVPTTPRASPTTRAHGAETKEEHGIKESES
jgi:hypothetical protein